MTRPIALIAAASLMALAGMPRSASASDQAALIDSIQVNTDGRIMVWLVGTRASKPACATLDYWFIADENSNAGKAQLAVLLAAHNAGRPVHIFGTGTCVRWIDGENIGGIRELGG